MICPRCQYVFVPPAQPPGLYAREYCPRCHYLYQGYPPDWHDLRGWLEYHRKHQETEA